jgi:hypothetical protein
LFDDAWNAFRQVPELFHFLACAEGLTLDLLPGLLQQLGAVDVTPRDNPYASPDPGHVS